MTDRMEKLFSSHESHKGLSSEIYKELLEVNNKERKMLYDLTDKGKLTKPKS